MAQAQQNSLEFPLDKFNDVLIQTKKVKQKLAPFIAQIQLNNMHWIYQMFHYLKIYLTKPKQNILYKFNSLYAIKVLFDTSDFVLVNWIEIFFLPNILEIASASFNQPTADRGKDYFLKLGYTAADQPNIQKFGYNYTIVALQLLEVATKVKPKRLFQYQFTEQPSDYVKAFQSLRKKGYVPAQKMVIYSKPEVIAAQIQNFVKNIQNIQKNDQQWLQKYVQFSQDKLCKYLGQEHRSEQQKYQINIIQVYQSGDMFLSAPAMEICKNQINQPQELISFKNSLHVIHKMILAADYQTFFMLNYQDTLVGIVKHVLNCDGNDKSLKRGAKILPRFKNPNVSYQLYVLFLDCLQKWGIFADEFCQSSKQNYIKKIVTELKQRLNLQLPYPSNFTVQKQIFLRSKQKNKYRNARLIQQIEKRQSQLEEILKTIQKMPTSTSNIAASKKTIQTSIKKQQKPQQIKKQQPLKSTKNINQTPSGPSEDSKQQDPFIKKLKYIQQIYKKFQTDKQNYVKNRKILQEFTKTFQSDLYKVSDKTFQKVCAQATQLNQNVENVLKKTITFNNNSQVKRSNQTQKFVPKKIQSELVIQNEVKQSTKKNIPIQKQNQVKQQQFSKNSKHQYNNLDTPVKKFQIQQTQKNQNISQSVPERQFFSSKSYDDFGQIGENSTIKSKSKFKPTQAKLQIDQKSSATKLGYQNKDLHQKKVQLLKSQNLGYQNQSEQKINTKNKQVVSSKNHQSYGYEAPHEKPKQLQHPQNLGYVQQNKQINLSGHKSMKKTESLAKQISPSPKVDLKQSSLSNVSKVEHYSPNKVDFEQELSLQQSLKNDFKKKQQPHQVLDQEIVQLQQDIQQNLSIHRPKQFKSQGRYKLQSGKSLSSRIVQQNAKKQNQDSSLKLDDFKQHQKPQFIQNQPLQLQNNQQQIYQSSKAKHHNIHQQRSNSNFKQQGEYIPHQQEQYQHLLDEDEIDAPNIDPMEQSFHDIEEIQKKIKESKELSFKHCFQTDKYVLPQDKKSKIYWLENDTNNLIKTVTRKQKSRISKINVPQILQQRNKKFHQELKTVQQEKNRKIKELEKQVKSLKVQTQTMKDQIIYQKEEIKTLKATSEFDKESHGNGQKGYLLDMENIAAQKFHSPSRLGYTAKPNQFDTSNFKDTFYLDPKGKLINSKTYKQYFQQFKKQKQKKSLLKTKDLLHKDKQIQIGCMSRKQNDNLIITFYITPEKDIESLTWTLSQNNDLRIVCDPNLQIPYVRSKKQQKLFLTVSIKKLPYHLPQISFHYKIQQQPRTTLITIPCSFHKFIHIKQSDQYLSQYFTKSENIIRGQQVPYSKKILKNFDLLKQYFQSISILNKGQTNSQGEINYGGIGYYQSYQFPIRISIKPNQFLYVQGSSSYRKDQNGKIANQTIIQFYISLVTFLLMKDIE